MSHVPIDVLAALRWVYIKNIGENSHVETLSPMALCKVCAVSAYFAILMASVAVAAIYMP